MDRRRGAAVAVLCAAGAASAALAPTAHAYSRPGTVALVSAPAHGGQGDGDSGRLNNVDAVAISMTPDGRFVAFESNASNLVPGDLDSNSDVFLRDRRTGRIVWVSAPAGGLPPSASVSGAATCGASGPSVSAGGRYVAFTSCYPFLDGKPTFLLGDVFVRNMRTGADTRVSVGPGGVLANGASSQPSISADGRFVAFTSAATNIATVTRCPDDVVHTALCALGQQGLVFLGNDEVYVRDVRTGVTRLVSVTAHGQPADGESNFPSISPDGRFVAFTSTADNLSAADDNDCSAYGGYPSCADVFVKDLKTGALRLVSVGLDGHSPPGVAARGSGTSGRTSTAAAISADDRYVAFTSGGSDLVPNSGGVQAEVTGCHPDYYVRDLVAKRTQNVSVDSTGRQLCSDGQSLSLDATGRYAVFQALCPGSVNAGAGGYFAEEYDRVTGTLLVAGTHTARGAVESCTDVNRWSLTPVVSSGGRFIAFASNEQDLVANDSNGKFDVFVQDVGSALGVGGLAGSGKLTVAGAPGFRESGLIGASARSRLAAAGTVPGARLRRATLVYRPQYSDLFARIQVAQMPTFAAASPLLVYGLDLRVGTAVYEVRVAKDAPLGASIGLFRRDDGRWTQVDALRGGYGTTGEEVVFALPLRDLGLQAGGRLSGLRAFAGVGGYLTGAADILDQIRLSR